MKGHSFKSLIDNNVSDSLSILNIIAPKYQKTEISKKCLNFACADNITKNCLESISSEEGIKVILADILKKGITVL